MPKGEPLKRTVTKDRWNKKAGYKTKGFNLRGDIADNFAAACERAGRSQASVIMELMERYIKETE